MTLAARPLVLVVDDDEENRRLRMRGLSTAGCDTLAADSLTAALDTLRDGPPVDLILTDNNLGWEARQGGINLAYNVKNGVDAELPVILYSSYAGLEDLDVDVAQMFALIKPRGDLLPEEFDYFFSQCREIASQHRLVRESRATDRSELFCGELLPVRSKDLMTTATIDGIEDTLTELGYRLKLIHPSDWEELSRPVAIWVRSVDGQIEAQVCGQPVLHWQDATESAAIRGLVSVISGFSGELSGNDSPRIAPLERLHSFLTTIVKSK